MQREPRDNSTSGHTKECPAPNQVNVAVSWCAQLGKDRTELGRFCDMKRGWIWVLVLSAVAGLGALGVAVNSCKRKGRATMGSGSPTAAVTKADAQGNEEGVPTGP